jgi:hypothetical protein
MKIQELLEDGTSGGTTSSAVPALPGGRQPNGKGKRVKANLLGFVMPEGSKDEQRIIKRQP